MTALSRIIGLVIAMLTIGLGAVSGRSWGLFVNLPSLLFVLGIMLGGLLISFRPSIIFKAAGRSIGVSKPLSRDELDLHIMVFARARPLAWVGGFLGTMTGLMQMMMATGPGRSPDNIRYNLLIGGAIAILCLFYAAILAEVIITPLKHSMIARFEATSPE